MTYKHLLITTALTGLFAVGQAAAQQGAGEGQGGGQGQAQQRQAQQGQDQQGGGLPGQRLAQERARYQGTQIYISPAGTRQVQQALNNAGYSVGNVDGQWNQQTQQAARNFQQAQGLEPTGTLTVRTIYALGLNNLLTGGGQASGLPGQRLAQERATGQGTPLYVSPAAIRQLQQALNEAGYDVGNVDGQWSQQTARAAMNFQQANGLEPTGVLDVALINALGQTQQIFSASTGGGQGSGGLQGQRLAQEQATGQGTPLYLGPSGVRQITQALNNMGYFAGAVDGRWEDRTQQAARNFQQAQGLEPTGTLTTQLLAAVGMMDWMQGGGATPGAMSQQQVGLGQGFGGGQQFGQGGQGQQGFGRQQFGQGAGFGGGGQQFGQGQQGFGGGQQQFGQGGQGYGGGQQFGQGQGYGGQQQFGGRYGQQFGGAGQGYGGQQFGQGQGYGYGYGTSPSVTGNVGRGQGYGGTMQGYGRPDDVQTYIYTPRGQ